MRLPRPLLLALALATTAGGFDLACRAPTRTRVRRFAKAVQPDTFDPERLMAEFAAAADAPPVDPDAPPHKAGFATLFGRPNAGKSTLLNALLGSQLSLVNRKASTTRHRILGVVHGDGHQISMLDTPGILDAPEYALHERMMRAADRAISDADVLLVVTDIFSKGLPEGDLLDKITRIAAEGLETAGAAPSSPGRAAGGGAGGVVVAVNKMDMFRANGGKLSEAKAEALGGPDGVLARWEGMLPGAHVLPVSALAGTNVTAVRDAVVARLPPSPPLYSADTLTDRSERFFAAELIRGAAYDNLGDELPYSINIRIDAFKESGEDSRDGGSEEEGGGGGGEEEGKKADWKGVRIEATILVAEKSQKGMVIGAKGKKIKDIGTAARVALEEFLGAKVYLDLRVKEDRNWRNNAQAVKAMGY